MQRLLYSVLMTMDGGEIQLGGYLRQSVLRPPVLLPVLPLYCPHPRAANGQRNRTGPQMVNVSTIAHSQPQSGVDDPRQCMYKHYTVNVQVEPSCSTTDVYCTFRHCTLVTNCFWKTIPALSTVVCTARSTVRCMLIGLAGTSCLVLPRKAYEQYHKSPGGGGVCLESCDSV